MDDSKEIVSCNHNRTDVHTSSQRLWQRAQGLSGLHQVLCIYIMASNLVFLWSPKSVNEWVSFLGPSLGLFSFVGLPCPTSM